jgi:hypothetical protein
MKQAADQRVQKKEEMRGAHVYILSYTEWLAHSSKH